MFEHLMETISRWLGREEPEPAPNPYPNRRPGQPLVKQVYEGPSTAVPEFAKGLEPSAIIEACVAHVVCEYTPHIEQQRIYCTSRRDMQGNLEVEYEGIMGSCGATKNFGLAVAQDEGSLQAYRYVDLNHIYACCCGDPEQCPFYVKGKSERDTIERKMRKLPEREEQQQQQ